MGQESNAQQASRAFPALFFPTFRNVLMHVYNHQRIALALMGCGADWLVPGRHHKLTENV